MVEMDIFCRSNPLRLDMGTADIIVAEHNYCEEVNVGFWIAYPTCPVIDSFHRLQTWVHSSKRASAYCDAAFDQKLIHFAWLGQGPLSANSSSKCRVFSQRDQIFDPRADTPVALQRISYHDIMRGQCRGTRGPTQKPGLNNRRSQYACIFGRPLGRPRTNSGTAIAAGGFLLDPRKRPQTS